MHRLNKRISSAKFITVAKLTGHKLLFHKIGRDTSGKCDAFATGVATDQIFGVVYSISNGDKLLLDEIEGLGKGYAAKDVELTGREGECLKAVTYIALQIDKMLSPYHWYKEHVLRGALEHGLPVEYIKYIEAVESVEDPDQLRHKRELSIYSN